MGDFFFFTKMQGFNLAVMTCMGLGHLTKKTQSPRSRQEGLGTLSRSEHGARRNICSLVKYFWTECRPKEKYKNNNLWAISIIYFTKCQCMIDGKTGQCLTEVTSPGFENNPVK